MNAVEVALAVEVEITKRGNVGVEVPAIERIPHGEVVPKPTRVADAGEIARLSVVEVAHLETAPPPEPDESAVQMTFPFEPVVSFPPPSRPEQTELFSVEKVKPPPVSTSPLIVEEADVALIAVVWSPPANVEVAEEVAVITPAVSVPMLEDETSSLTLESSGV